jgi:AcrR family transcriptional regulator
METQTRSNEPRRRLGGRSARVRSNVLAAAAELLAAGGYEDLELPEVARRAGVHPTTVYRRWPTKGHLVGEALLERSQPLSPTPDTGSLATDLEQLLQDGAILVRTPAVRALFQVLLAEATDAVPELVAARNRFWAAHQVEAAGIVERAVARHELAPGADASELIDLVVGPALLRLLLMGQDLGEGDVRIIVARAIRSLSRPAMFPEPGGPQRHRVV